MLHSIPTLSSFLLYVFRHVSHTAIFELLLQMSKCCTPYSGHSRYNFFFFSNLYFLKLDFLPFLVIFILDENEWSHVKHPYVLQNSWTFPALLFYFCNSLLCGNFSFFLLILAYFPFVSYLSAFSSFSANVLFCSSFCQFLHFMLLSAVCYNLSNCFHIILAVFCICDHFSYLLLNLVNVLFLPLGSKFSSLLASFLLI